jgi:hydrogenase/urease accessory protein HupE
MMRLALGLIVALLLVNLVRADEARPVYIEVVEQSNSQYLLKWKVPPVMSAGQEPRINLLHPRCALTVGKNAVGLTGRKIYHCQWDLGEAHNAAFKVELDYPNSNPALTSLIVFKPLSAEPIQVFSGPEETTVTLPFATSSAAVAKQYTIAGIEHILVGTDHLLFVLCLIIIAGDYRRLLLTVTGFTLAHSVTLSLATLNIFRLPTELVEWLIALSILLLAVEIIKRSRAGTGVQDSFTWRHPVSASSVFGLLHGFGFAVVLQELGLPATMKIEALLFFNIGVEVGQLLFIAAVVGVTMLGLRAAPALKSRTAVLTQVVVYGIGITSAYWLLERAGEVF